RLCGVGPLDRLGRLSGFPFLGWFGRERRLDSFPAVPLVPPGGAIDRHPPSSTAPEARLSPRWAKALDPSTTRICNHPAPSGIMKNVIDRATVSRWLAGYEAAWRAPGTESLAGLFTSDATYLQSPYEQPVTGLDAIKRMWEEEREGPDEVFTLATDILAVDGL